jgi:hypothetical protein
VHQLVLESSFKDASHPRRLLGEPMLNCAATLSECLEVVAHARELAGASEESATCCMIFTEGRGL